MVLRARRPGRGSERCDLIRESEELCRQWRNGRANDGVIRRLDRHRNRTLQPAWQQWSIGEQRCGEGASNLGRFAANQILQNGTSAILSKALGLEADLGDALQNALASTFAAAGFNLVGDLSAPDVWNLQDCSLADVGLQ